MGQTEKVTIYCHGGRRQSVTLRKHYLLAIEEAKRCN